MVTKLKNDALKAVPFVSSGRENGTRVDAENERVNARSHKWLDLFCTMYYNQLVAWVEGHDFAEDGYSEAIHVLWCRTCLDDVMAGKLSPKNVPMLDNLDGYFAK